MDRHHQRLQHVIQPLTATPRTLTMPLSLAQVDYFTHEANAPKEALMRILQRLISEVGHDAAIVRQLSAVIHDLEAWQNR